MGSDDEYEEDPVWKGVPATIILINAFNDTNATMLARSAVCRMLREYLRQSSTQYISVCFYGVKNSSTSNITFQDVFEAMPLTAPTLADYKKVLELDISKFDKPNEFKLSEALWFCSNMFEKCKKQLLSRTVIIMSKLDVPPAKSDEKNTYTRVTDLVNTDSLYSAEIKIINLSQEDYKVDVFYENFAVDAKTIIPKPIWDCKEIEKLILQQSHRNLAVAQLNFEIGNGFEIGVGVYTLLKSTYQPKKVKLNRDTNALITTVNKTLKVTIEPTETGPNEEPMDEDEESIEKKAVPLLKSEIVHYQEYGGETVQFTDAEKKAIDNPFGPPMLKLLGFKPASMLCKEKWFLKPGYFLYPNENRVEGSTTAFKALHQACIEMSVVAICILCTRVNSRPNIVALSPSSHPLNLSVEIGFDVIHIPFVEHVRNVPAVDDDTSADILEDQKKVLKEIINGIQFEFKPDMFEDPKVQSLYRNIEAIALSEEDVEPFHDTTKPSQEAFENLPVDAFEELFGPFGEVPLKRANPSKGGETRSKKAKVDNIDDSMLQIQISSQQVHKYTVDQLKQILKSKEITGLPALTGMKKAQLVDLVYQHFG